MIEKYPVYKLENQWVYLKPDDLNYLGTLFGGRLLAIVDAKVALIADAFSGHSCATLTIDNFVFKESATLNDVLVLNLSVNRVWNTSMEIGVQVLAKPRGKKKLRHIVSAYFVMVAVDKKLKSIPIGKQVVPRTKDEKRRYKEAEKRRKNRLNRK